MEKSYRNKIKETQRKKRRELSQKHQKLNHPEEGRCCFVHPIKSTDHIKAMKEYLYKKSARDYLLFILGINNGLRTGDLLKLKVKDLKDLKAGDSIKIKEGKTKKVNVIFINKAVYKALKNYLHKTKYNKPGDWLFPSQINPHQHINTIGCNLMIKSWGRKIGIRENLGAHSLRKSWAYHQRVSHNTPIELIMRRLNHSSIEMTLRYACIDEIEINGILENEI